MKCWHIGPDKKRTLIISHTQKKDKKKKKKKKKNNWNLFGVGISNQYPQAIFRYIKELKNGVLQIL